jgi:hypothetical protein
MVTNYLSELLSENHPNPIRIFGQHLTLRWDWPTLRLDNQAFAGPDTTIKTISVPFYFLERSCSLCWDVYWFHLLRDMILFIQELNPFAFGNQHHQAARPGDWRLKPINLQILTYFFALRLLTRTHSSWIHLWGPFRHSRTRHRTMRNLLYVYPTKATCLQVPAASSETNPSFLFTRYLLR